MRNWKKAVAQFFHNSDPDGEYFHCAPERASTKTISSVVKKLRTDIPDELREFYEQFNGVGLTGDDSESPNFIPPIEQLPDFVKSARSLFPKSHKKYADRYLPVVDWGNGDTSGYMFDEGGTFIDCLFMFNHETCTNEASQDVNEYLTPVAENLYGFLSE